MDRNFILPVSIAAAIHAGLLFGVHRDPAAPSAPAPAPVQTKEEQMVLLTPKEDDIAPAPADPGPPVSVPDLPEVVRTVTPQDFTTEMPPRPQMHPDKVMAAVPPDMIGGNGHGGDFGQHLFTLDHLDNHPRARVQVAPQYPFDLRKQGISGKVEVEFTVNERGEVMDPHVISSSDRGFEEPTLRAILHWRFEPGRAGGQVVRFRMMVPVVFNIDDAR